MIRRHPHVFGDNRAGNDSASILRRWEEIKREEKQGAKGGPGGGTSSVMAGLLGTLPALMRAQKAQEKAARVGFDWPTVAEVAAKVRRGNCRGRGRDGRRTRPQRRRRGG